MMEGADYNSMASNRPNNDDQQQTQQQQQQQQQDLRRNRKADYRFLIPSRDAGAIIGKGGKIIQDLRLKHRCQIQMADCESPERVLIISGDQSDVLHCMSDILVSIHENHQRSTKPDQSEIRALIHQSQAGALIGKGASRVKEFREKHNIDVKIYPQCCPGGSTERSISMRGNKDDVINCLTEVYSVLEGVPPRGPYRYYDPSNYTGYNVSDYGGYADNQPNSRGNNAYGQQQVYQQYGGGGGGGGGAGYNQMMAPTGPVTTTQVTIPTDLAGLIIGAKGSKISQIRQESGASIKIDSVPMPGTNDRLITITGNPNQIQQAQFLLQQTVRQSGLWNP